MEAVDSIWACSTWIGEDLVSEILKRLPIKTLCRFRCVSKSWNSLISSVFFINLQYSFNSSTTPANLKPYLRRRDLENWAYYYDLCRPQEEHVPRELIVPARLLQIAGNYKSLYFVDLIHGVLCLNYPVKGDSDSIILWNPAIDRYIALPCQSELNIEYKYCGFGYSSSKNDFMVVRLKVDSRIRRVLQPAFEVCSVREGLWRVKIADNIINLKLFGTKTCFVNGIVHWVVSNCDSNRHSVLMFDCDGENLTTMELPQELSQVDRDSTHLTLLEYAGMLSVLLDGEDDYGDYGDGEMWVMEEHGVPTTWKKLYRISPDENVIDTYQSSYQKLPPYGPNDWLNVSLAIQIYQEILRNHVYEESMFLMDDPKVWSYTNEERA